MRSYGPLRKPKNDRTKEEKGLVPMEYLGLIKGNHIKANHRRYQPIDEILRLPSVKVLRCLYHCRGTWTSRLDLREMLGGASEATNQAISRLSRSGEISFRKFRGFDREYMITEQGIKLLNSFISLQFESTSPLHGWEHKDESISPIPDFVRMQDGSLRRIDSK